MFRPLIFIVLFGFALWLVAAWTDRRAKQRCPKYEYKYVPAVRSFTEEQLQPPSVFKMHQDMFWKQSPWVSTHANPQEFSNGYINPLVLGGLPATDTGDVKEPHDFLNDAF